MSLFASSSHFLSPLRSLPLCVLAARTPPKAPQVFKLPDFPASLSFHSVQNYYSELIQLLGKAIFSVQKENSTLLARYSAFIIFEAPVVIFSHSCPLHFYLYNRVFYHFTLLVLRVADLT